ncbi:hypothetical protein L0128_02355 [candidate division KSB1 bacterium]|nr:hypothetical protein [candidate division KSB1 bacterium]
MQDGLHLAGGGHLIGSAGKDERHLGGGGHLFHQQFEKRNSGMQLTSIKLLEQSNRNLKGISIER